MTAYVQKGKAVWLSKNPAPTGLSITAATKAKPCVLTVTNTASVGDIIRVEQTGFASLDGRAFEISVASGTSLTLKNTDTTDETATLGASATGYIYEEGVDTVETCFSSFGVSREAAATISAGTFCGTTSLVGQAGATSIEFAGFDDPESEGLKELIRAQEDGVPRLMVYKYPAAASSTGAEYQLILPSVTIAGLNGPTATPDGAATFSGTGVVNGKGTLTSM